MERLGQKSGNIRHLPQLLTEAHVVSNEPSGSMKPVDVSHRTFGEGEFWRRIPGFNAIDEKTFLDHRWQVKHSITKVEALKAILGERISNAVIADINEAFREVPMALRVSPYLLALMNWHDPERDPLRRQFIPMASRSLPDHPKLSFDSLKEQADAPLPGLTHRYPDKVLLLALDTCPVYCRFCTRSYAVGPDQDAVTKVSLKATTSRWEAALNYIARHPQIEDVVISGGDAWNLRADQIDALGQRLLDIDHVRRFRFASKGLAILPQKILTDNAWFDSLARLNERARRQGVDLMLHTHFNHPKEATWITQQAMLRLHQVGIHVRNQTVLQRGVNDDAPTLTRLNRRLGYLNIHPYYVYVHDMVRGTETLRTSIRSACELEIATRGSTAGFNTPTFVVDAPGGGGKRCVHSFDYYNERSGISVFRAPAVKPGESFLYFDPIDTLPTESQERWRHPEEQAAMIAEARLNVPKA